MKIDSQFGRGRSGSGRTGPPAIPGTAPPATTKLLSTREEPPHRHTHRPRTTNLFSGTPEPYQCHIASAPVSAGRAGERANAACSSAGRTLCARGTCLEAGQVRSHCQSKLVSKGAAGSEATEASSVKVIMS